MKAQKFVDLAKSAGVEPLRVIDGAYALDDVSEVNAYRHGFCGATVLFALVKRDFFR